MRCAVRLKSVICLVISTSVPIFAQQLQLADYEEFQALQGEGTFGSNQDLARYLELKSQIRPDAEIKDELVSTAERFVGQRVSPDYYRFRNRDDGVQIRTEHFDLKVVTEMDWLNQAIAIAAADSWEEYVDFRHVISYSEGKVYESNYNHFLLTLWLPRNEWLIEDVTWKIAEDPDVEAPKMKFKTQLRRSIYYSEVFLEDANSYSCVEENADDPGTHATVRPPSKANIKAEHGVA